MRLTGKVCIITGSSQGIGFAIAQRFLKEGATVIINSINESAVLDAVEKLKEKAFSNVDYFAADVSRKSDVEKMVEFTMHKYGKIDILVNNAGINKIAPSTELSEEDFKNVLQTNLCGVFFGCQVAGKEMIKQKSGSIINMASVFGQECVGKRAAYSSSKGAVIALTKVLAVEWAKDGVRVNSLAPGFINSNMTANDQIDGNYDDECIHRRTPIGRYGQLDEVANIALFLASDEASYVTGSCYNVDGGWTAYGGW